MAVAAGVQGNRRNRCSRHEWRIRVSTTRAGHAEALRPNQELRRPARTDVAEREPLMKAKGEILARAAPVPSVAHRRRARNGFPFRHRSIVQEEQRADQRGSRTVRRR
jgi:hypothetical protein